MRCPVRLSKHADQWAYQGCQKHLAGKKEIVFVLAVVAQRTPRFIIGNWLYGVDVPIHPEARTRTSCMSHGECVRFSLILYPFFGEKDFDEIDSGARRIKGNNILD